MRILKRRPQSGFVKYPKDFEKRIIDGTARFRTRCDMLVGPCSCGGVHQEDDGFVRELLDDNDAVIELIELTVSKDGKVYIPRYWIKPRGHESCNVISGSCNCGKVHTANEQWAVELVVKHKAQVVGCPESEQPMILNVRVDMGVEYVEPPLPDGECNCPACQSIRRRNRDGSEDNRPRRNQI